MKPCPKCGDINFNNAVVCRNCNFKYEDSITCSKCGKSNLISWENCIWCKSKLVSSTQKIQNQIKHSIDNQKNTEILSDPLRDQIFNKDFISIMQKLVSDQGKSILENSSKFKALLSDYTHGEYKKESRIIQQALEAGIHKAILTADDIELCKKQQIKILSDEYFWKEEIAGSVFNTLLFILEGSKNICKNCHKNLPLDWKACPYCGTEI